jgi:hypothetical protein
MLLRVTFRINRSMSCPLSFCICYCDFTIFFGSATDVETISVSGWDYVFPFEASVYQKDFLESCQNSFHRLLVGRIVKCRHGRKRLLKFFFRPFAVKSIRPNFSKGAVLSVSSISPVRYYRPSLGVDHFFANDVNVAAALARLPRFP